MQGKVDDYIKEPSRMKRNLEAVLLGIGVLASLNWVTSVIANNRAWCQMASMVIVAWALMVLVCKTIFWATWIIHGGHRGEKLREHKLFLKSLRGEYNTITKYVCTYQESTEHMAELLHSVNAVMGLLYVFKGTEVEDTLAGTGMVNKLYRDCSTLLSNTDKTLMSKQAKESSAEEVASVLSQIKTILEYYEDSSEVEGQCS